jgi:hypothetical protein
MDDLINFSVFFFAFSLCLWGIYCFYISIRIERFIVKRYEQETDLLDTVYFKEHATFIQYIPNFFSSAMYTSHLLTFIWGWKYFRKRKPYRDIKEAHDVIRHFSEKELRQAKWFAISGLIVLIHIIAYYIFKFIWPAVFN